MKIKPYLFFNGRCEEAIELFKGFSLSLDCPDADSARESFAALAQGGQIHVPMGKTFWAPLFGMVTDRFGVGWMVGVSDDAA